MELNKLFKVEYGNKFDLNKMALSSSLISSIAFVGRSGRNNGVTAYVERNNDIDPYRSGLITVALGGAILSSFVQPKAFYTAQNIAVLIPLSEMTLSEKLYYCACIRANQHRYGAFGREANRTLRTMLVPSSDSIPTWVPLAAEQVLEEWKADLKRLVVTG